MADPSRRAYDLKHYPGFGIMAAICMGLLYLPLCVLVFFSFNERRSVSNWSEFSLQWYSKAFANDEIQHAAVNSLSSPLSRRRGDDRGNRGSHRDNTQTAVPGPHGVLRRGELTVDGARNRHRSSLLSSSA